MKPGDQCGKNMALGAEAGHAGRVDYPEPNPRKRLYIILAVLAVLLVVAAVFARPVYHSFKHWRALQLVQASEQALQARDLQTASDKANTAMQLWPDELRVIRQEARVLRLVNPFAALAYWNQVWVLSHDLADLRQLIELAINIGNFPLATAQFPTLQKLDPDNPLTWMIEGKILLSENRYPEALADFKKIIASDNAPPEAHLYYARAAGLSDDPVEKKAGLDHLLALSNRSDELGHQALSALIIFPHQPDLDYLALADKLEKHPLVTRDDKTLVLELRGELPSTDEDSLVKAARDLFPANDTNALSEVGSWLVGQNRNEAVLKLIDPASALKRRDLFLIRAGAMAALGQWELLGKLLQDPKVPLSDDLKSLFQVRTLLALHQDADAELMWKRLLNDLRNQPAKLLNVAFYARKLGLDDYARPALEELTNVVEQRRSAYVELISLEHHAHNTGAVYTDLTDMAKYFPTDAVVQNDLRYIGFLRGDTGEDKLAAARDLVAKNPTMLSFRVTLAAGLLLANRPAEALQAFDGIPAGNWPRPVVMSQFHTLNEGNDWNAVYVGVLRANGLRGEAAKIEAVIQPQDLLPEERNFLLIPLGAAK